MPALEELPVHPFTGQRALGVLPSGRVVWPIKGGAPEDGEGEGDDVTDDDDESTEDGEDGTGDGDGLGDKGQKALAAERKARRDAVKRAKALEAENAALKAERDGNGKKDGDGTEPDAAQLRRDAEATANKRANERILKAEIRAAATGKLADPSDASLYLDLSEFEVADDGSIDSEAISDAISDLIKRKPHLAATKAGFQGTGDGGARTGGSRPKQLGPDDLKRMSADQIVKARQEGRLTRLMGAD